MIVIVDYGMGNLRSVSKALEHLGAGVKVSSLPSDIDRARKLVLPGVGAFGDAVKGLQERGLFDAVLDYLENHRPFLGICLGLQLLFESSEEDPTVQGLGVIRGTIRKFRSRSVKIPHMGWNQVNWMDEHPLLEGIPNQSYFYFVHSYYASPHDSGLVAGVTEYGEDHFAAVIAEGNLLATQFHPEKSQEAGLVLLKNFVDWKV
ncbi:MAG: imidazole glycerol phosphate synthase subunit HisH [Candidatus Omnitrophota bacterium]